MAEWLIAAVLKTVMDASLSGVRIPLPPLNELHNLTMGEVPEWLIGTAC